MNKINLKTPLGYSISLSEFTPESKTHAVVMICSATGVKQTLYLKFAQFLREHGFIVYTFDYGGIGESKPNSLKSFNTCASHWAENDSETVVKYIKNKHKQLPFIALGHSIGGQLLGIVPSNNQFDGIVLVAAQMGYWKMWKGLQKFAMAFLWYLAMPLSIRIKGYFPGKLLGSSEDLPKDMALEWRSWCMSPNYLFDKVEEADKKYQGVSVPVYSISAEDDKFAPQNVVNWISQRYENAAVTRIHLMPKELNLNSIGHFGYFRSDKKVIWHQLLGILNKLSKPK